MIRMRNVMSRLSRACHGLYSITLLALILGFQAQSGLKPANTEKIHSTKVAREKMRKAKNPPSFAEVDFKEALEDYIAKRAYPNDFVDWDAIRGAVEHRERMGNIQPFSANQWEFLGPRDLQSPMQWAFGPARISGRCASAAIDPTNPQKLYIASSGGGAWRSSDGGATWSPMGDGWQDMTTSCVVVAPTSPNTIYVGTGDWDGWGGYSHGIQRSTDGGNTWVNVGKGQFGNYAVRRILVDPNNSQIVTAVTGRSVGGNGKVWRSTDGGDNWTAVISTNALWTDIVCGADDGAGNRAYYASAGGSTAQVWISNDRGANWVKLTTPLRQGNSNDTADLAASPTAPGTVYLLGTGNRKVWKSTNFGGSWTDLTDTTLATPGNWGQAWYDFYITCATKGSSDVLYVGLVDIFQSWNGTNSWRSFLNGYTGNDLAHVDQHDMVLDPTNPNRMLVCNDGGVYSVSVNTSTGVGTFTGLNANLGMTEFYYGDFHPTDANRMLGGAQDNGSPAGVGAGVWRSVTGGDGGAALINQTNPSIQYTTYQYFGRDGSNNIGVNKTTNNWASSNWVQVNCGSDRVGWMGPIVMAATDSNILYLGTNYLYKYVSSTNTWTQRLGAKSLSSGSTIACIGVTAADANVIYTGSGDGELWVTRNGGTGWTQINTGTISLPNRAYTAVHAKSDNANDVLVGLSGTGSPHLWRCTDTSSGTRTWINVSGTGLTGLPDIPINAIERDPSDTASKWYVGTDIGVFRTTNAGNTWENITQPLGLPNVAITGFKLRNNYLCAVTYGRGMWRLSLSDTGGGGLTLTGLTLDPTAVVGPAPSTGTVTISAPAPLGGTAIALSSNNGAATVPLNVTIPEGATSANFNVTTTSVPSQVVATITANLNSTNATADLTVNPNGLTEITVTPVSVIGGNNAQGVVRISTPAPAGGASIQLNSNNVPVASVPSIVLIPQGQTSGTFTVVTNPTPNDALVTLKATYGTSTVQTQITVKAPTLTGLVISQPSVVGGNSVQATITLDGKAPSGGAPISMESSDTNVATVPAFVTVPANATSAVFVIVTKVVPLDSGVTIKGTYHAISRSDDLIVTSQKIQSVTFTPNPAVGGSTVQGRVTLAGPAAGSITVSLQSSSPLALVPQSVTIATGQTFANFNITTKTVTVPSAVTILATFGASVQQGTLNLEPLNLANFTLSSNATFERQTIIGTVTLNGPALAGGAVVQLSQTNPAAATIPTSVTIPQGQTSKTFNVTAAAVTSTQFTTITATRGTVALQQQLSVSPIMLESVQLNSYSVTGGTSVSGVVRLAAPAPPGGYVVNLTSSITSAATVPVKVTIPQNATSATFTVTTYPVAQTYFPVITARHVNSVVTAQLQVLPPEVKSFTVSPTSVKGGTNVNGTVTLTGKAPAGGITVTVMASPNLARPTATVTVPAGATSKTFAISTNTVISQTQVTLSARTFSAIKTALLTLKP